MSDTVIVQSAYDAFSRGDIAEVLATFAADITWTSPVGTPWGGEYNGPGEVAQFFQRLVGGVDSVRLQVNVIVEAGPGRVLVEGSDHYVIAGAVVEIPFAHVVLVRDGAISSFTEYANVVAMAHLLGAAS